MIFCPLQSVFKRVNTLRALFTLVFYLTNDRLLLFMNRRKNLFSFTSLLLLLMVLITVQGKPLSTQNDLVLSDRYGHDMIFDEMNERTILFGGVIETEGTSVVHSNETWNFNSTTKMWDLIQLNTSPGLIAHHSMAYSVFHEKIVCFGGLSEAGAAMDETWIFDCQTDEWSQVFPPSAPPSRSDASFYYDTNNQLFILFGGYRTAFDYYSNDLWAYNLSVNTWTKITSLNVPPEMYGHQMVYDPLNQRGILFGGRTESKVENTIWTYFYHNSSWKIIDQEIKPITRYWHSMSYDKNNHRVLILGGRESEYIATNILNDVWNLNLTQDTWIQMDNTAVPEVSSGRMVYDLNNNVAVLFGGVSSISPFEFMSGTFIFDFHSLEPTTTSTNPTTITSTTTVTITTTTQATTSNSEFVFLFLLILTIFGKLRKIRRK